jgi:hypothetical protein
MTLSRQHPFVSPVGCLAALVILAGLGIAGLVFGGAVFSPGRLTARAAQGIPLGGFASHAEFENDCGQCHAPFRGVEAARCERCHTDVAAERTTRAGLHGGIPATEVMRCAACHTDHRGREFDPLPVALVNFDHTATGFALTTHAQNYDGAPLACQSCHAGDAYAFDEQTCAACHAAAEADFMAEHIQTFGNACLDCHDGTGNTANFDHNRFFPLEGAHAALECEACHAERRFQGTPSACVGCHAEPEVHAGLFGTDCAACHSATAWTSAAMPAHVFPLNHGVKKQETVPCATCHPSTFQEYTCYGCHKHEPNKMAKHHAEKGIFEPQLSSCASCHPNGGKDDDED